MKNKLSLVVLATLVLVLISFVAYVITHPPKSNVAPNLDLTTKLPTGVIKAPTPYLILPTGIQEYTVQNNSASEPNIIKITADPIEGPLNSQQTISVDIKSPVTVTAISFALTTDNQTNTYQFKLISGTNKLGTWSGSWQMADPHKVTYYGKFIIKDESGRTTNVDFPIR